MMFTSSAPLNHFICIWILQDPISCNKHIYSISQMCYLVPIKFACKLCCEPLSSLTPLSRTLKYQKNEWVAYHSQHLFIKHCNLGDFPHTKKLSWLRDAHVTWDFKSMFVQHPSYLQHHPPPPFCLLHSFTSFHHLICLFPKFLVPSTFKVLW